MCLLLPKSSFPQYTWQNFFWANLPIMEWIENELDKMRQWDQKWHSWQNTLGPNIWLPIELSSNAISPEGIILEATQLIYQQGMLYITTCSSKWFVTIVTWTWWAITPFITVNGLDPSIVKPYIYTLSACITAWVYYLRYRAKVHAMCNTQLNLVDETGLQQCSDCRLLELDLSLGVN